MSVLALLVVLFGVPVIAAEPKAHCDLSYAEPKNDGQTLDVFAPAEGKNLPVVVWIRGGGWRASDKADVQKKPQAFVLQVKIRSSVRTNPD